MNNAIALKLLKDSGLTVSLRDKSKKAYDYRGVFMVFPRFPWWRNARMELKDYKYKEELIDSRGDLLISKDEILEYLEEDSDNITQLPK